MVRKCSSFSTSLLASVSAGPQPRPFRCQLTPSPQEVRRTPARKAPVTDHHVVSSGLTRL
ncbi:hypothetical protein PF010_g26827 [Phytophthora fragariae]|uniref:Uncharacterized protein n=1 Tax=Phytophthora fragariae TaxID=53985 RepID=A0A6G0JW54_9STRA|nr:hypothetical protein PF010_g26827 [Phytophthora fragariae]